MNEQKLAQCHTCNGTVSKTAKTCPHCGQKKPYKSNSRVMRYILTFVLSLWFLSFLNSYANYKIENPKSTQSNAEEEYSEEASREMCQKAIGISVNNPSTLDIDVITGYATKVAADGTRLITQSFSAKNSFGLEKDYDAYCTISSRGKLEIKIVEQDGY